MTAMYVPSTTSLHRTQLPVQFTAGSTHRGYMPPQRPSGTATRPRAPSIHTLRLAATLALLCQVGTPPPPSSAPTPIPQCTTPRRATRELIPCPPSCWTVQSNCDVPHPLRSPVSRPRGVQRPSRAAVTRQVCASHPPRRRLPFNNAIVSNICCPPPAIHRRSSTVLRNDRLLSEPRSSDEAIQNASAKPRLQNKHRTAQSTHLRARSPSAHTLARF